MVSPAVLPDGTLSLLSPPCFRPGIMQYLTPNLQLLPARWWLRPTSTAPREPRPTPHTGYYCLIESRAGRP